MTSRVTVRMWEESLQRSFGLLHEAVLTAGRGPHHISQLRKAVLWGRPLCLYVPTL